jgi:PEP-CTERM motif.
MNLSKLVLGVVAALGFAVQANAAIPSDLGTLSGGDQSFFSSSVGAGSFSDTIDFRLTDTLNLRGLVSAFGVSSLAIGLDTPTPIFTFTGVPIPTAPFFTISDEAYSFADLAPSVTHTLYISGVAARGGAFISGFAVAAVPEAETWLMIMVGFGLVAFQLQRKQKSLSHHPLTAAT